MKRARKVGSYSDVKQHLYKGLEQFLEAEIITGVHTFRENSQVIDVLYEERASDVLIVFFTAAISLKDTYPKFSGRGIASRTGNSLLSFSDPAISRDTRLLTNWTLGDANYQFHHDIPKIIARVAKGRRIIFVGASAGGYPALHFGSMFPESVSFVMNPRTKVFTEPTHIEFSKQFLFPGLTTSKISSLIPTGLDEAMNTVVYYQNLSDTRYFVPHAVPYFVSQAGSGNVHWKLGNWGSGHVAPKSREIAESITALSVASSWPAGAASVGAKKLTDVAEVLAEQEAFLRAL